MRNLAKYSVVLWLVLLGKLLFAQSDSLIDKKYTVLIYEACVEMTDAGCMEYNYGHLSFSEKTVIVSGTFKVKCTPPERESDFSNDPLIETQEYKWKMDGEKIIIKGLDDFRGLKYKEGKILGRWKSKKLEFIVT